MRRRLVFLIAAIFLGVVVLAVAYPFVASAALAGY